MQHDVVEVMLVSSPTTVGGPDGEVLTLPSPDAPQSCSPQLGHCVTVMAGKIPSETHTAECFPMPCFVETEA